MKATTTTPSVEQADASLEKTLNPDDTPRRRPVWRPHATIGTVLSVVGRMTSTHGRSAASRSA